MTHLVGFPWASTRKAYRAPCIILSATERWPKNQGRSGSLELAVELPPGFTGRSEWADYLSKELAAIEQAAALERRATGKRVLGRSAVSRVSAFDAPTSSPPRRVLRPWIAAKRKAARIAALDALMAFWADYRRALAALARRTKRVLFPEGTYRWRHLGLPCADNPKAR